MIRDRDGNKNQYTVFLKQFANTKLTINLLLNYSLLIFK
jgi:hypothetical protein